MGLATDALAPRARLLDKLLADCRSEKVKRLFFLSPERRAELVALLQASLVRGTV